MVMVTAPPAATSTNAAPSSVRSCAALVLILEIFFACDWVAMNNERIREGVRICRDVFCLTVLPPEIYATVWKNHQTFVASFFNGKRQSTATTAWEYYRYILNDG
jgi:hypothetical protein